MGVMTQLLAVAVMVVVVVVVAVLLCVCDLLADLSCLSLSRLYSR